jgi:hypothetical protein
MPNIKGIFKLDESELERAGISKKSQGFLDFLDGLIFFMAMFISWVIVTLFLLLFFFVYNL